MEALQSVSAADWLAFTQTAMVAAVVLATSLLAALSGRVDRVVSRKALHIGMGGTYVLHWLLFSDALYSRYMCALVPTTATVVFLLVGMGLLPLAPLVRGATRGGRREELLTEPLLYGLVHTALTVVFFTASPAGVITVAVFCFGDGAAELVGRNAKARLPYNRAKTWAGSCAFLVAAAVSSTAYAFLFRSLGTFDRPVGAAELAAGCAFCAAVGAAVESLPLLSDNIAVPLATAVASVWFFGF